MQNESCLDEGKVLPLRDARNNAEATLKKTMNPNNAATEIQYQYGLTNSPRDFRTKIPRDSVDPSGT